MPKLIDMLSLVFYAATGYLYYFCIENNWSDELRRLLEAAKIDGFGSFGGRWKFLTQLNLVAHCAYFNLCTLNAVVILSGFRKTHLSRFLNLAYVNLTFPVGLLVTLIFWAIYFVNKELIYPSKIERIIPPWQNHVMHTLPLFAAVLDNFFTEHYYNRSFLKGFFPTFVLSIAYTAWIYIIAHFGGFWVYPILRVLTPVNRGLFVIISFLFISFLYKVGELLNSVLWSKTSVNAAKQRDSVKATKSS